MQTMLFQLFTMSFGKIRTVCEQIVFLVANMSAILECLYNMLQLLQLLMRLVLEQRLDFWKKQLV